MVDAPGMSIDQRLDRRQATTIVPAAGVRSGHNDGKHPRDSHNQTFPKLLPKNHYILPRGPLALTLPGDALPASRELYISSSLTGRCRCAIITSPAHSAGERGCVSAPRASRHRGPLIVVWGTSVAPLTSKNTVENRECRRPTPHC